MKQTSIFFIFLLSLGWSSIAIGQQDTLSSKSYDELREIINYNSGKDDSLALLVSNIYLNRAIENGDVKQQLTAYIGQASLYAILKDEKHFTEFIEKSLKINGDNNREKRRELIYERAAGGYYSLSNWAKSVDYYEKLREIAANQNKAFRESSLLSRIAFINTRAGDVNRGLKLNKEALFKTQQILANTDSLQTIKDLVLASNHYTLTSAYLTLEKPDSALYHIDQALKVSTIKDSCSVKYLYFMQADGYIGKNQLKKAGESLDKAGQICRINTESINMQTNVYRGEIALNKKQYRKSVDYFLKALKDRDVPNRQEGLMGDVYNLVAKAYKGLNKLDSANLYLEKYINTSNELSKIKKDIYTLSKRKEAASFQKELNELSKQKTQKENLILYGGIAGGTVIILLILVLVRSNKKRKENEQKFETLLLKINTSNTPQDIIDTKDEVLEEQQTTDVNPETTQQILDGLKKLEEQKYFLHLACSAHNVSKRIKTNTTYLSKVINAEFGKNFSTYVNDLRINYAIVMLKQDTQFRNYTISSIAKELGYKSADSFTKYFKKDTGLLPSFYIKKLNEAA